MYKNMGHNYRFRGSQGSVMGIYIDLRTGLLSGAADSRSSDGGAAGF
jgi:hypothetical protein